MRIKNVSLFVLPFLAAFCAVWVYQLPRPRIDLRWMLPKDTKPSPPQVNQKIEAINKQIAEMEERKEDLLKTAGECRRRGKELERAASDIDRRRDALRGTPAYSVELDRSLGEVWHKDWEAISHYNKLYDETMHLYDTLETAQWKLKKQRDCELARQQSP